jgi:error-prone DNA polymerase
VESAPTITWNTQSSVFERQRRLVLAAGMLACRGQVQREGEVVHVVAHRLEDLSDLLRSVEGRGDARPARDTHVPGPQLGRGIRVPTWDFR